jgi:hypothetical protein
VDTTEFVEAAGKLGKKVLVIWKRIMQSDTKIIGWFKKIKQV